MGLASSRRGVSFRQFKICTRGRVAAAGDLFLFSSCGTPSNLRQDLLDWGRSTSLLRIVRAPKSICRKDESRAGPGECTMASSWKLKRLTFRLKKSARSILLEPVKIRLAVALA